MEDVKAYIESGILELYALGDLTPAERLQVEAMAFKHPEVRAELDEIEKSMERYAEINAVETPDSLRDRILNSLVTNFGDDRTFKTKPESVHQQKAVNLVQRRQSNFFKYAFAACLALLIISLVALINVYNRWQNVSGELVTMQQQNQRFASRANYLSNQIDIFRDPSFRMMKLNGTSKTPQMQLMIGWSPRQSKLVIDMARSKMPVTDRDHSYQLWAIVSGKPVDLGVFEATEENARALKEMPAVDTADAFAVTLEPRGGSPTPTMDNMMVVGNTK